MALPQNLGKAEAVRAAVMRVASEHWDYIGFWDADLATPLSEIASFIPLLEKKRYWCVMGARIRRLGAEIERKWYRHVLGRVFATVASLLLRLPVYDTQCGAKFYSANVVQTLFERPFVSRWFFDFELLFRVKKIRADQKLEQLIYELPLSSWCDANGGALKLKDFLLAPRDMWKIYRYYNSKASSGFRGAHRGGIESAEKNKLPETSLD